jgi:heat shock protein HslJ
LFPLLSLLVALLGLLGLQGCASIQETKQFKQSELTLATIGDTEWVLKAWTFDEPAPVNPEVTLIYRDGQFAGKSGCNRFFVSVKDREMAGDISVGLGGSTKMACPDSTMEVEDRFLDQLSRVKKFGFMVTKLALSYEKDGAWKVMLFESRKAQLAPKPYVDEVRKMP